jgi:hypothetical protein
MKLRTLTLGLLFLFLAAVPGQAHAQISWYYHIDDGFLQLKVPGNNGAVISSVDTYIGDQAVCGTTLSCYFHQQLLSNMVIGAHASVSVPVGPIGENIYYGAGLPTDFHAFFVYVTSSQALTCDHNRYSTTEHNPGDDPGQTTGDGTGPAWLTHQGGGAGLSKVCDNVSIAANTPTQVQSDNAGCLNSDCGNSFAPTGQGPAKLTNAPALPVLDMSPCMVPAAVRPSYCPQGY